MSRAIPILLGIALASSAAAAQSVRERLEGRVPAAVVPVVTELAAVATARDLPAEALIQKALEGGAKGVPADRIIAAVRLVHERLETAARALDAARATRTPAATEAGVFALTAGLAPEDVRALAAASASDPVVVLRVAGTLSALGVPRAETVALVVSTTQTAGGDVAGLPQTIQAAVARGATPAQAARLTQGGGRRGQPQGPPPDRPGRPKPEG